MEIVIDIDENDYGDAKMRVVLCGSKMCESLNGRYAYAIANGTPLPKGHGRLIDADALQMEMEKDVRKAMSFVDLKDFVWLAPTIIEGSEEE